MMNSKDFIIKELEELSALCGNVTIRYEDRKSTNSHIIEITPVDVFKNDDSYIDNEIALKDKFYSVFPNEDLVFVSSKSLSRIRRVDFEILQSVNSDEDELFIALFDMINNDLRSAPKKSFFATPLLNEFEVLSSTENNLDNNYALAA